MRLGRRAPSPGLACSDVVDLLTDYLESALPSEVADRVAAHLAECEGCTTYLEQLKQTSAALGGLAMGGLPDQLCAELVDVFRDWTPTR